MAKIVLDSEPIGFGDCPFGKGTDLCGLCGVKCNCVSGYYDSRYFDFDKCIFCTALEKLKRIRTL